MARKTDISVIICTRDRAASLEETLRELSRIDAEGLEVEIVVVDNASRDGTAEVVRRFRSAHPVRYLREERPGKGHALNRALDSGDLGGIIAVLDDDMSPRAGWFAGVKSACDRWPDVDMFTGHTFPIWPRDGLPSWVHSRRLQGWAFSVMTGGRERPYRKDEWPLGGHFWFRRRMLDGNRRFAGLWAKQPQFGLRATEDGYQGIFTPAAAAGHRIQEALLERETLEARARLETRETVRIRLCYPASARAAEMLEKHPVLTRIFCRFQICRWAGAWCLGAVRLDRDARFERTLHAYYQIRYYSEILRNAGSPDPSLRERTWD